MRYIIRRIGLIEIKFPKEYLYQDDDKIADFYLKEFTGNRSKDKSAALAFLKDLGYDLHHAYESGHFQLVDDKFHSLFTHYGGVYSNSLNNNSEGQ